MGFVQDRNTLVQVGVVTAVANGDNFSGVDVGGGLEWMFAPNWSLFVEYDHIFRSSKTLSYAATTGGVSFNESVRRDFDKVLLASTGASAADRCAPLTDRAHAEKIKPRLAAGAFTLV
jgi:hypothetical protein